MVVIFGAQSRNIRTRLRDRLEHDLVQDVVAGLVGLLRTPRLMIFGVRPSILMSIWMAVMPFLVPATLKSMSPKKSSTPWISHHGDLSWSPSVIRPQEMPATGALIGTPASIRASVEPQTEPWEVEPLEEMTSETRRRAYGNSSPAG